MTTIVGLEHEGIVYMGGDSMSSNGTNSDPTALSKVFIRTIVHEDDTKSQFLIGYTSSFRMGQILQHHLTVRTQADRESDETYMVVAFIEAVRDCLKTKGYTTINNNTETAGTFMVGYRGTLWTVYDDFQVNRYTRPYNAIGAGGDFALGAMVALKTLSPEKRIRRSLEIASDFSLTRPPFIIRSTGEIV